MRIIRPATIAGAVLVNSSVPDTTPAWQAGATYAAGDRVQDSEHREFESVKGGNTGHALSDPAWWLDVGATNRWRMFDQINGSQTIANDELTVDLKVPGRVDAVALLNVAAATVHIVGKKSGTTVYDRTFAMTSTSGVGDWFDYFFEPVVRRTELIVMDLPRYPDMDLRVTVSRPGGEVRVGTLTVGQTKTIGMTLAGMGAGINDYSRKDTDDFGNYRLVKRAFSKKLDVRVLVENGDVDRVIAELTRLRATPLVWVATERFDAATAYGFYRNFSTTFEYPEQSICLIEIEGLS